MSVPALPPLPPRSATEIVDGAVQLIRPEFGYFLRIAAVGAIPALIQSIITLLLFPATPMEPAAMLRREYTMLPLTLLTYAFATMQSGAIIGGALALLRGDVLPTVWEAFMMAFRRILALLGANLLLVVVMVLTLLPLVLAVAFAIAAGGPQLLPNLTQSAGSATIIAAVVALLVLGLIAVIFLTVFARSAIMSALVIAEGLGPVQALRRAHFLSAGSYIRLAKTYGLVLVIVVVVYMVLGMVALAFRDQQQLVQALLSVMIIPVVPILGSIMLLTYADLRVRREGADLDAALDALPSQAFTAG